MACLCAFAEKLTLTPHQITSDDIDPLRQMDLDDVGIHDVIQIIAYFNYINPIADALGVEPETFIPHWGETTTPRPLPDKE